MRTLRTPERRLILPLWRFVSQIDEINSLARSAAGFVAQPTLPDEGAVYTAPFLLNVSIWESIESLEAFTHQGKHAAVLERRGECFEQQGTSPNYVLYWIPKGHLVTEKEIKERLAYLGQHGPTPNAFTFKQPFAFAPAIGESLTRREVLAAGATLVLAGDADAVGGSELMEKPVDLSKAHLRLARPSDDLAGLFTFYRD